MIRQVLTPEQQLIVDDYRTANNVKLTDVVVDGTNLVVDDQLEIDNTWPLLVVLSGDGGGAVNSYIPDWGDLIMPIDLIDYVTDRIGPQAQTMPIFDEVQLQARTAAKTKAPGDKHHPHTHRRSLEDVLRDAVKRLPHKEEKHALAVLKKAGVLDKKDRC